MLTPQRVLPVAVALVLATGCSSDKAAAPKPRTQQCVSSGSIALGGNVAGNLASATCRLSFDSSRVQHYTFTLTQATPVTFTMTAAGGSFDPFLILYRNAFGDTTGFVAFNDDADMSTSDSKMRTVLGPGTYVVAANHVDPKVFGAYTLGASTWNGSAENCDDVFMTPGTSTEQSIATTDCKNGSGTQYGDVIAIYVNPNQGVNVDVSSTWVTTLLQLYDPSGSLVARDDNTAAGSATHVSAPASAKGGLYVLVVTAASNATGPYSLALTSTGSGVAPAGVSAQSKGPAELGSWPDADRYLRAKSAR
ncbi:MAG: hypothetical protein HOQ09_08220 [Gemmatimonadaceae bacterium]|nr:hypothetical protein [Gemmatimonadaceae bacterium]